MDKDRSNHVGLPLFLEGCKALGYEDEEEANFSVFLPFLMYLHAEPFSSPYELLTNASMIGGLSYHMLLRDNVFMSVSVCFESWKLLNGYQWLLGHV